MKLPGGKPKKVGRAIWVTDSLDPLDEGYFGKLSRLPLPNLGEPAVQHIGIAHDDWCPKLKGGPCRCDPDVEIMSPGAVNPNPGG